MYMSMLVDIISYVHYYRHMNLDAAVVALSALSQETRLRVFKLLIEYGRDGTAAGNLSDQLEIPHNTLSFHLSHLSHAGLVNSSKRGRQIIYSANCEAMEGLLDYLRENCCIREAGREGDCAPRCKPISKPKRGRKK